jgi:predicted  nucleic acid-binding Zn-ribbon protein
MAKKVETSVEEKLRALFDLQLIDSRIDQIRSIRGELPLEVEDLENEIAGLNKRLDSFENEIKESQDGIKFEENAITTSKSNHKKYEADLKKVRNNREYNAIVKEQEFQELEIKLSEKKINQYKETIENKNTVLAELNEKIKDRKSHLKNKNSELGEILKETEKEEKTLLEKSKEFEKKIEDNLISAYKRIRSNVKNGLAIVPVERNASGGSYFTIPPQVQMEIASRQKIITDEYSGRILIDPKLAEEEMEKMKSIFS